MRRAYNLYANSEVISGKELLEIDSVNKTGVGTWLINDCLDFNDVDWRYSFPQEDQNIDITHEYDDENKTLTLTVKKDGARYDPRGFTVAVNYADLESEEVAE